MYKIHFYRDENGKSQLIEYLIQLVRKQDKDSQLKFSKISGYIRKLGENGFSLGMPYIRHLDGNIWELRPMRDRILFAAWSEDGGFVLLHQFMKQTQKTPQREIEKAKREYKDFLERGL